MNVSNFSFSSSIEPKAWADWVATSPHADVLQCLEWGSVKKPDWQPIAVAMCEVGAGESIVASALILKRKLPRLNRSIFYLPRGPILDWNRPEIAPAFFAHLKILARKHRAILIKVDPAVPIPAPQVLATLKETGFVPSPDAQNAFGGTQPRFNMKLEISGSEADVQTRFHQKWRYNVRYAARKGIRVVATQNKDDIGIFHEIYRTTAQRDGFVGRPRKYFEKLWDALVPAGLAQFFITYHEETPLSGAICFALGEKCWYVYGASSNEMRNLMPNHLMQWEMMQWARGRGCTLYDFRGVHDVPRPDGAGADFDVSTLETAQLMESSDGLVRFKAGFGATLSEYCGEWDWPLQPSWYWLWTSARPKIVAALKKRNGAGATAASGD